jgi:hypothetical protein
MWALYLPLLPYYIYLSIKAKSFGFFNAVNPSIYSGGMGLEKKSDVNKITPSQFLATSFLIVKTNVLPNFTQLLSEHQLTFPIIAKPNIGCRGNFVKKINSLPELQAYHDSIKVDYLIEELINYKNEVGIFYCRMPNEVDGKITGIVLKKGVEVIGNGTSTIGELISKSYRYYYQYDSLFKNNEHLKNTILEKDKLMELSAIGNHARGATFYDITNQCTPNLTKVIDDISKKIPDFYYGRYDIKFNTWKEFEQGKNYKIIEINGAGSEPTHMYDPNHTFVFAIKEYSKHWQMMYEVAKQNHKKGFQYFSIKECRAMLAENEIYYNKLR